LKTWDGKPFEALKELSGLPKRGAREWAVCFEQDGKKYTGRLCAIRKNAVAAARAREKMRQKAIKRQKTLDEEALKLAEFVMVFTTVSQDAAISQGGLDLW
jgi:predicted amino acid dehydrogenase